MEGRSTHGPAAPESRLRFAAHVAGLEDHGRRETKGALIRLRKGLGSLAGGVLWAAVYNAVWGTAWLGFMRREWADAASSSGHLMPWTRGFWALWLPITLFFGIAIGAYLTSESRRATALRPAVSASLVMWVPGTIGMAVLLGFSARVIVLDSVVNLLALMSASVVAGWSRRWTSR